MNFNIVKRAGLTPKHIAWAVGVSRVTGSNWLHGHGGVHFLLTNRVERFLEVVKMAVDDKKLPAPKDLKNFEKEDYIRKTLTHYVGVVKSAQK